MSVDAYVQHGLYQAARLCHPGRSELCHCLEQIVKKVELEAQRAKTPGEAKGGRKRRNPVEDLKREVAIMRTLRHKNIVSLQVSLCQCLCTVVQAHI